MAILDFLWHKPKPKPILTSRPIFQFSSSFIDDDKGNEAELRKPTPPLPLFHQRFRPEFGTQHDIEDLETPVPKSRSRLYTILHVLNTIFTFSSLTLFIAVIPIWDANFQHTRSVISGDYTDGLVLAPLFLSIFTSASNLVTEHTSLGKGVQLRWRPRSAASSTKSRKAKYRTRILLILTILLLLAFTLTFSATNSLALAWKSPQRTKDGLIICNLVNIMTKDCQPVLYQIGSLQIAGIVTGGLAWGVWVILLVLSIRDSARERKEHARQAARERKRRRHERKRRHNGDPGGGQSGGHRHRHRHRHDQRHRHEHKPAGEQDNLQQARSRGPYYKPQRSTRDTDVQEPQRAKYARSPDRLNYSQQARREVENITSLTGAHVDNPAVQLASYQVRPQESMQVWLNNRRARQ